MVPEEATEDAGEGETMDLFMFALHVFPVLVVTSLAPTLGFSLSLLLQGLFLSYLYWTQKVCSEREKRRIKSEERKKINTKRVMTEGETMRWMNEGLKVMWPISMENFASQHFFKPMAPWFLKKFKPAYVKDVKLQSLHLGSTPPDFRLIRALPSRGEGDDVVFEASMEFLSGKDMNAQMTVLMKGIKTTFYISKLYIKGTVKFSVKFVKGWPVLGRIRFSFAHTPIVDMTARAWNSLDIGFIPGAANWLEETLGTALEQSVVEPYMLVIDFEKLVSNMMSSDLRPRRGLQDFFSVDRQTGLSQIVLVEILEAGELKPPNTAGLPDPFVEVTLGKHREKTKSQAKTLNPVWENEMQRIPILNWALPNLLTLRVISKRNIGQRELGMCTVPVKEFQNGERHVKRLKLENVPTGWIQVAITVENSQGVEEPTPFIGSQPTTRDIPSNSPPLSTAATATDASLHHTRSISTETVPAPEEGGSSEIIKMPYGGDGAFEIQLPGADEALYFSDPPTATTRKPKNEKAVIESKARDAKVKGSMMNILRFKRRSKVSNEDSPPGTDPTWSDPGYSSSLDHSTELKIYNGPLKVNLLSPEMPSREPPSGDIQPLRLETVLSENREATKTPDMAHAHNDISVTEAQPPLEVKGSTFSRELTVDAIQRLDPEKQYSRNPWWKNFTKRPRRRAAHRGTTKPHTLLENEQPEEESYDPSDTSGSQSFRREPRDIIREVPVHHDTNLPNAPNVFNVPNVPNVPNGENGHSILSGGRSQSDRRDSSSKKIVLDGPLSHSTRFDPSSSLLKTIPEKRGLHRLRR